jgi:predicted DNA-binding transcriptional regulator AlpA
MVRYGIIENIGTHDAPCYRRDDLDALLATLREQLGRSDATFADVASKSELAKRWKVATTTVNRMILHGVLTAVTIEESTMIVLSSVETLDPRVARALDPDLRIDSAEVARLAGLARATVLHHVSSGALPTVRLYPRSQCLFLPDEVDPWLARRRATAMATPTDR